MKVMIDTNLLVYAWDSGDKEKQSKAIDLLRRHKNQACLSVQNLSEFSAVMIRKGADLNWLKRVISIYSEIMYVLPLTSNEVKQAIHAVDKYGMSFWDAQIWAVAKAHAIPVILTEDGPTGREIEGVWFKNPLN